MVRASLLCNGCCVSIASRATARCHLNMLRRAASKNVRRGSARSIAPRATPGLVHRELLPVYAAPRQTAAVWGLLWAQARNRWARILAECLLIHLVVCVPSQLLNDSHKPGQDTPKRAKVAPPVPPPGPGFSRPPAPSETYTCKGALSVRERSGSRASMSFTRSWGAGTTPASFYARDCYIMVRCDINATLI